ncbi:S8 family serine peptidase [Mycoplasma sp. P36-A1]|uniref:S8 family serine peptidase n=1 Tax=Mycoplasma sp. P36-A1 TaxID=3252900 RepID=UPI003C2B9236
MKHNRILTLIVLLLMILCPIKLSALDTDLFYDSLIIELEDGITNEQEVEEEINDETNNSVEETIEIDVEDAELVEIILEDNTDLDKTIKELEQLDTIKSVNPNFKYKINNYMTSSTCSINNTWHLSSNYMNYNLLSNDYSGHNWVEVGILDTGVNASHKELKGLVSSKSYDFTKNSKKIVDKDGHGSHVASTIGGKNIGLNRTTKIVSYRVLDDDGYGSTANLIRAINKAKNDNIKVLNLSLGINYASGIDKLLYNSIANYNGLVVAAAGNSNSKNIDYPAGFNLPNIISVNSISKNDNRSWYSNYNAKTVDIAGYGENICAANGKNNNGYIQSSGTSMSTPMISGTAANLLSIKPNLSYQLMKNAILDNSTKIKALSSSNLMSSKVDMVESAREIQYVNTNIFNYAKHTAFISKGSLYLYGANDYGQLGTGNKTNRTKTNAHKVSLPSNQKVSKYYITRKNTFIVTNTGNVYVTGANDIGQINNSGKATTKFTKYRKLSSKHKITAMDFRLLNGKYNENNIKYILKQGKNETYYKVGSNVKRYNSNKTYKTKTPIYVIFKNNVRASTSYYTNSYKLNKKETWTYSSKRTLTKRTFYVASNKKRTLTSYWYKNNKISRKQIQTRNTKNKRIKTYDLTYTVKKVKGSNVYKAYRNKRQIKNYKNGTLTKNTITKYNNVGKRKANSKSKSYLEIRTYKKGRLRLRTRRQYNKKGKLSKRGTRVTYTNKRKKANYNYKFA